MANTSQDNHNRTRKKRNTTKSRSGSRPKRNTRKGESTSRSSSSSGSRRGTLTRPDTGYTLHSRRVHHDSPGGALKTLLQPRVLILLVIGIIVILVLVFGISSCVKKNNEAASQTVEDAKPKNEQDERVAAGVSAAMTSKFTEALDNASYLSQIAEHANEYEDERLLTLALNEPKAVEFVAKYLSSDKSSKPYSDSVKRGEVPTLYDWDSRWGAVTYGKGPLAVTGSGPTTLAMAYMGLTGKTDYSPAEIAQQASKSNYADGDTGSKVELFSKTAEAMGLTTEEQDPSAETLSYSLGENTVYAVELKADTLTKDAHWALVVNMNDDGSVTVFDPTSSEVSSRPWPAATIANSSKRFFAISPSEKTLEEIESQGKSGSSSGSSSSTSSGSGTSSSSSSGTSGSSSSSSGSGSSSGSSSGSGSSSSSSDETSDESGTSSSSDSSGSGSSSSSSSSGTSGSGSSSGTSGSGSSSGSSSSGSGSSSSGSKSGSNSNNSNS